MTKPEAIALVDGHRNKLIDPGEMLRWTWLRVILNQIPEKDWERYLDRATEILSL